MNKEAKAEMEWPRLLAYITGRVDQELLLRNEYLAEALSSAYTKRRLLHDLVIRHRQVGSFENAAGFAVKFNFGCMHCRGAEYVAVSLTQPQLF